MSSSTQQTSSSSENQNSSSSSSFNIFNIGNNNNNNTSATSTSTTTTSTTTTTTPTTTTSSNDEFVIMSLYWDEWSRCIGSRYQKDHLYRLGHLDSCSKQWKDLKIAARAKVIQFKNPDEARKLIESTYYKKRTTISPTAGAIWEIKQTPGWD